MMTIRTSRFLARWRGVPVTLMILVLCATAPGWVYAADTLLRLGTWNIEWLGKAENRSHPGRNVKQKPEDLAAYIVASQVDVLGLQEISDDDALADTHTNKTLTLALNRVSEQTNQTWQHRLFPKPEGDIDQLCGVAWNAQKVTMQGEPHRITLTESTTDCPPHWQRHPYATQFTLGHEKTDFVVIVLHMKSNRDGTGLGRCRRTGEARTLMQALPTVHQAFTDQDVVLLGDTNILAQTERAARIFRLAGFHDLNSDDVPTRWIGQSPFDRVFTPTGQSEFVSRQQQVFGQAFLDASGISREQFKRRFSDHFMVITEVAIDGDDD